MKMQEQSGLPVDENKFLIGIVSRLTYNMNFFHENVEMRKFIMYYRHMNFHKGRKTNGVQ